jgi:hypothetical protein
VPKLLSVQMMSEAQRQHPRVVAVLDRAAAGHALPAADLPWRVCLWWKNDGSRPTDSHGYVLLGAETPREVLLTTVIGPYADADTGRALLAAARKALDTDVLDAKRPLLVLADWLEDHGLPQHALLRAFCGLKQHWVPWCMEGHSGATLDREALRAGKEGG